jgi:N-acetylmuramoyl-L-alanine amidase
MKILIDNGHGENTQGKRSPDGKLREYAYTREIAKQVVSGLISKGFDAERIVCEEEDISLKERVKRVNDICNSLGKDNVILISIHCNAASNGEWTNAKGWSAYTSKGGTKSDILASYLYKVAEDFLKNRKIRTNYGDDDPDWEENFYILKNTNCPAVLTENFFMDNKDDVSYLLSEEGKNAIIQTHINGIIEYLKNNKTWQIH